jgi:hypothetical protein
MIRTISASAAILLAATAFAAPRDPQSFTNVDSNGPLGNAVNQVRNFTVTDSYLAFKITFSGNLAVVNAGTFASEARAQLTPPAGFGAVFTVQPFTQGTFTGTLAFTQDVLRPAGANPQGNWTVRFFESFDDGGTSSVDANWTNFDLVFDDTPPPPPPPPAGAIDLGDVSVGTNITDSQTLALPTPQIIWYRINVPEAFSGATFMDVTTLGSSLTSGTLASTDTELGIYAAPSGTLVANDDDGGPGLTSQLSFGGGRRLGNFASVDGALASEGLNFSGQNGATLPAGEYYIANAGFNATFNATNYNVTTTSARTGTIVINIKGGTAPCGPADFNADGSSDFFDYLDFVQVFDAGCP